MIYLYLALIQKSVNNLLPCLLVISSEEWSKVGDTERGNLGITVEDDGEFWWVSLVTTAHPLSLSPLSAFNDAFSVHIRRMSFADWCQCFTDADVCRLINTSLISVHKTWHEVVHFGSWTKNAEPLLNRCGGCSNHKRTFLQNPQVLSALEGLFRHDTHLSLYTFTSCHYLLQYLFDVTKEVDEVLISLQQKDIRIQKKVGRGDNLSIGFGVFKVKYIITLSPIHYYETLHKDRGETD